MRCVSHRYAVTWKLGVTTVGCGGVDQWTERLPWEISISHISTDSNENTQAQNCSYSPHVVARAEWVREDTPGGPPNSYPGVDSLL